jgi:hypothetical protein
MQRKVSRLLTSSSALQYTVGQQSMKHANIFIMIGLAVAGFLGGIVVFYPKLVQPFTKPPTSTLARHVIEGVTIDADLKKEALTAMVAFLRLAIKPDLLPSELTLALAEKGEGAKNDAYIASWNKDGKFMGLLVASGPDPNIPSYLRIWTMQTAETIDKNRANELLNEFLTSAFIASVGELECRSPEVIEKEILPVECAKMHAQPDGMLLGLTVRTPVTLASPSELPTDTADAEVTIASACAVPKEGALNYTSPACI